MPAQRAASCVELPPIDRLASASFGKIHLRAGVIRNLVHVHLPPSPTRHQTLAPTLPPSRRSFQGARSQIPCPAQPLCRASRQWRWVYSALQQVECAPRLRERHGNPSVVFATRLRRLARNKTKKLSQQQKPLETGIFQQHRPGADHEGHREVELVLSCS
jgi:hypothetical protein